MRPLSFVLTLTTAIASVASAGSLPPEIAIIGEPSQVLNVTFQTSTQVLEVQAGELLTSNDTTNRPQPNLAKSGSVIKKDQKYVFMMVDPGTNTTDPTSVALHTIVTNLTVANSSSGNTLAQYIAPEPSGTAPHNYTLLLFKQPSNFTVASIYDPYLALNLTDVYNRVNFPLRPFINSTGLEEPVAANCFWNRDRD
ncbi:PEBP-like protein [Penicillium verhagenii]|uniref:PEBP-like protein n=1 Tax=Penicillium verhagenii TaxID=1562060 RepID=UPI0025450172|nr:PEBP-like protein [Penicillium verhagenii]KAJ5947359.1 PEBP-like protein [Penicillium verhagenii]